MNYFFELFGFLEGFSMNYQTSDFIVVPEKLRVYQYMVVGFC